MGGPRRELSDGEINLLVQNEKEWRLFLVQEFRETRKEITTIKENISASKYLHWLSRAIAGGLFGMVFFLLRDKF